MLMLYAQVERLDPESETETVLTSLPPVLYDSDDYTEFQAEDDYTEILENQGETIVCVWAQEV